MSTQKEIFFTVKDVDMICGATVLLALSTELKWRGFEADLSPLHQLPRLSMCEAVNHSHK
jgi:hypothetical protein